MRTLFMQTYIYSFLLINLKIKKAFFSELSCFKYLLLFFITIYIGIILFKLVDYFLLKAFDSIEKSSEQKLNPNLVT